MKILEDALSKQGYVLMQIINILMMGIAGAGKTSVMSQMITGLLPKHSGRCSTALLEAPIRAVSKIITKVTKNESDSNTDTVWSIVSADELLDMIASALLARGIVMEPDPADNSTSSATIGHSAGRSTSQSSQAKSRMLELLKQGHASDELTKVQWIHFTDTGGQPQFRELLPSVVHSISMIMHVLRLSEELDKHPSIEFYEQGKACCNPLESALTNEQILQQTVRSIQVQSSLEATKADEGMDTKGRRPKIIVVGTHRDLESQCSETRAQKNTRILKLLSPFLNDVLCNGLDDTIFSMNAVNPDDADKKVISKIRSEVTKLFKVCGEYKIPVAWFLLEQDIRKFADDQHRGVVSFKECLDIAKSLTIHFGALIAALSYFHQLNVFLYYPSLLPNVVFCNPQVLLNIISLLVSYSYKLRSGGSLEDVLDGRWFRFRDQGLVTVGMLEHERFKTCFVPDLFSPTELIKLLQHLFIAVPINSSKVATLSSEFFVPCLLPILSPAEFQQHSQLFPPGSPHILLVFPSGCVPNGIFSNIIVRLRSKHNWKVSASCVYSNCIELFLPDTPLTVTLMDSFRYLEARVQVLIPGDSTSHYEHVFPHIRLAIIESIEGAIATLKFVECTPVATFLCRELGHRCSCVPHAAEILADEFWKCSENPRICGPLSKDQLVWLNNPVEGQFIKI